MEKIAKQLIDLVISPGICTGCGACVGLDLDRKSSMKDSSQGPIPEFFKSVKLPALAWKACPGRGIDYSSLYKDYYGYLPEDWLLGCFQKVRVGYSAHDNLRQKGASGGVLTTVLIYLLETGKIDAAILASQGYGAAEKAHYRIVRNRQEILECAQSVYIPVSMLDAMRELCEGERYAITCLPDQAAALRRIQLDGFKSAQQIKYILGPYTGTSLYPSAIDCFLRSKGVSKDDAIVSLQWRAGDWPGYLEIKTKSGKVLRTKKVYYNFLIPFFITQSSLQGIDFTNEFTDLSVGDAWSPQFEKLGGGHSVVVTRSLNMEQIIQKMIDENWLTLTEINPRQAVDMHGHMLDFKKRGGYLRNRWRKKLGLSAPDYGIQPTKMPGSRIIVEIIINLIFLTARNRLARKIVQLIPERYLGPVFNNLRLFWKKVSKPTKRKGLADFKMEVKP
jgi:coenzyme F420 hydrogenase subunit beta